MDEVIEKIKAIVLKLDSTLSADDEYLDIIIESVVDRFLIHTNRDQLVAQYEDDLLIYTDSTDDFWDDYDYPVPARVHKVLAQAVVGSLKSMNAMNSGEMAVTSASDNGQSVSFGNKIANYFGSAKDQDIFAGFDSIVSKYIISTMHEYTRGIQKSDKYVL